ncbi:MAG: hypothetical protein M3O22_03065 [Pseudomonadota bacterium]|nr:hypothetical protein [Pseudomonadota bacterium]
MNTDLQPAMAETGPEAPENPEDYVRIRNLHDLYARLVDRYGERPPADLLAGIIAVSIKEKKPGIVQWICETILNTGSIRHPLRDAGPGTKQDIHDLFRDVLLTLANDGCDEGFDMLFRSFRRGPLTERYQVSWIFRYVAEKGLAGMISSCLWAVDMNGDGTAEHPLGAEDMAWALEKTGPVHDIVVRGLERSASGPLVGKTLRQMYCGEHPEAVTGILLDRLLALPDPVPVFIMDQVHNVCPAPVLEKICRRLETASPENLRALCLSAAADRRRQLLDLLFGRKTVFHRISGKGILQSWLSLVLQDPSQGEAVLTKILQSATGDQLGGILHESARLRNEIRSGSPVFPEDGHLAPVLKDNMVRMIVGGFLPRVPEDYVTQTVQMLQGPEDMDLKRALVLAYSQPLILDRTKDADPRLLVLATSRQRKRGGPSA